MPQWLTMSAQDSACYRRSPPHCLRQDTLPSLTLARLIMPKLLAPTEIRSASAADIGDSAG